MRWEAATAGLSAPFAIVDLDAMEANRDDLVRRAGGLPLRLATKSVRSREIIRRLLASPGWRGVMAYSLAEALWLRESGVDDLFVAYPSTDPAALARLAADDDARTQITLTIDSVEHLAVLARWLPPGVPVRLAIDVDASLRLGPVHLGVRRSPLRTPGQATALARAIRDAGHHLDGVLVYDAQIAGLPDSSPAVRWVKARSDASLRRRRSVIVAAITEVAGPVRFVNGGGTGSLEITGRDPAITELAAGSGVYGPTLFDGYDAFAPRPAAAFALPVVRRPARDIVTVFAGGYIASGAPGRSRLPTVCHPPGLSMLPAEGAGEVQTPLRGPGARALAIGDRVWLRHAKAGELCERFDVLHLIRGGEVVDAVPTYRGEGMTFG